jgi:hypothetical protein
MPLPDVIWSTNHHYRRIYMKNPQPPSVVSLTLPVKDRRKRDPHNYCGTVLKAVIDGLVQAGAWPDDTPEYVGHREPVFRLGGKYVVIEWSPLERTEHEGMDIGDLDLPTAS